MSPSHPLGTKDCCHDFISLFWLSGTGNSFTPFLLLSELKTLKFTVIKDLWFLTARISFCFIRVDKRETPLFVDMIPSAVLQLIFFHQI